MGIHKKIKSIILATLVVVSMWIPVITPNTAYANPTPAELPLTWRPSKSQDPHGSLSSHLDKVSCASASFCQAKGSYYTQDGITQAFIQTYDGKSWKPTTIPIPANYISAYLQDIVCVTNNFCVAVGQYNDPNNDTKPLLLAYNGSRWTIEDKTLPAGAYLDSVSCVSAINCKAVGHKVNGQDTLLFGASFDGESWSATTMPNPDNITSGILNHVSCVSASKCIASGEYRDSDYNRHVVIEVFDGTSWSLNDAPVPPDMVGGGITINDLTCYSESSCFAVGYYYYGNGYSDAHPYIAAYDGTNWNLQTGIDGPSGGGYAFTMLSSITCTSATSCIVVGRSYSGSDHGLIQYYDGSTWSLIDGVEPEGSYLSRYNDISCTSATSCHAIGYYITDTGHALINIFDGDKWSFATDIDPSDMTNNIELISIDCSSISSCHAVGYYGDANNITHSLIEDYTYGYVKPNPPRATPNPSPNDAKPTSNTISIPTKSAYRSSPDMPASSTKPDTVATTERERTALSNISDFKGEEATENMTRSTKHTSNTYNPFIIGSGVVIGAASILLLIFLRSKKHS